MKEGDDEHAAEMNEEGKGDVGHEERVTLEYVVEEGKLARTPQSCGRLARA